MKLKNNSESLIIFTHKKVSKREIYKYRKTATQHWKREGRYREFFHPSVREKLENGKWRRDL